MSAARLDALGKGRFRVSGVLDAATVREVLEQSEQRFADQGPDLEIDLGGVSDGDSAGLALLIEWLRSVRHADRTIRFTHVPAQIEALARISEVEDLITGESHDKTASKEPEAAHAT